VPSPKRNIPVPPSECVLRPLFILGKQIDDILIEYIGMETTVIGRPRILAVEDVVALAV
jgi:hypothetical protein